MSSSSMMKQEEGGVLIDLAAKLNEAESLEIDESCIYRVPFEIRRQNEDAYTPKVVSIGPFHHGSHPRLQNMERHKLIYCKAFLKRAKTSLDSWIKYIEEEVEPSFRRYYSDTIQFSREELVKLIVVDSAFIFELFSNDYYTGWSEKRLIKPWLENLIRVDLVLLENQLPFFVLDSLFKLSFPSAHDGGGNDNIPSFLKLTFHYFSYFNISNLHSDNISICHFTDLIRAFHLPHPPEKRPSRTFDLDILSGKYCPSATELSQAGVRFKVNYYRSDCLLDLSFSGRVLEIPQLIVNDQTEIMFRNMVALEMCHYPFQSYITDYVVVLSCLVKTKRDADILVRQRVLLNWLENTDSVATMFNSILKETLQTNFNSHYVWLFQHLNAFCRDPWHNLKANLRRWQGAAIIGGSISLILTLVQAVCSILQVINK